MEKVILWDLGEWGRGELRCRGWKGLDLDFVG